ncbi:hypothetical protein SAMN05444506_11415 [Pseudomonas syringae]|uniref:Plasmid partitioning protein ParA n=2 Tax=Pseudomonas TaxID=286 RepID=A0A3M3MZ33_9PSED|nr:hypothetical protein ALQ58_02623 [Pseudomonas syringae pv. apii]RMN95970.1 hypothetical protein ALQ49_02511 [Pseudomonas syringae pv. apii]SDZ29677.1 hypothetical protein SAMN05444506_11415 [Pseudomonas syringae]
MNLQHCRIVDGELWIERRRVCMPYPVNTFLQFGGKVLIRLEPSVGTIFNRNIFAVSMAGEVLWQIDESSHGTQADKPFMSLYRDENDQVVVGCWNGVTYAVDVENGNIRVIQFDR